MLQKVRQIMSSESSVSSLDNDISDYYVQIEDYTKLERLGHRNFNDVYSARDEYTGALVAVKILRPDPDDANQRRYYNREVTILATVRHVAILPLVGCTPFDGPSSPVIITPLMQCSVQDMINAEAHGASPPEWTPTQKHIVLLGIAEGMRFMHTKHVLHRDLKPANVLLNDAYEPLICDFGLSKFFEKGSSISQSMSAGTTAYMAPDLAETGRITTKIDVYSFAILMFTTLTGLNIFPDTSNFFVFMMRVVQGYRPPIPDSVKPAYAKLMRQCWSASPDDRPSFREIVVKLGKKKFLKGLDIDAFREYQSRVCPRDLIPPLSSTLIKECCTASRTVAKWSPIEGLARMADGDDAQAQVHYGLKLNPNAAVRYFSFAAPQNDSDGLMELGHWDFDGCGVPLAVFSLK
jgi:serine/threonine protein kinase